MFFNTIHAGSLDDDPRKATRTLYYTSGLRAQFYTRGINPTFYWALHDLCFARPFERTFASEKRYKNQFYEKIYHNYQPNELLSIPMFAMGKISRFDFKDFNPEFERVVEIYNAWGSSECTAKEGNLKSIKKNEKLKNIQKVPSKRLYYKTVDLVSLQEDLMIEEFTKIFTMVIIHNTLLFEQLSLRKIKFVQPFGKLSMQELVAQQLVLACSSG